MTTINSVQILNTKKQKKKRERKRKKNPTNFPAPVTYINVLFTDSCIIKIDEEKNERRRVNK